MKKLHLFFLLYVFFIFGALFRFYAVNWDNGHHMHPDERAIILSVVKLSPPMSLSEFVSADSSWNPKFFAYGSLPFYMLYWSGQGAAQMINPALSTYDGIEIVGRYLSAIFDLGTMIWLYLIAKRFLRKPFPLLAVFFYAVSTLPIQLSHFYAVDTLLTFFITGTLYLLLRYLEHPSLKLVSLIGFLFGCALATKMSAATLLLPIGITFSWETLTFIHSHHKHIGRLGNELSAVLTRLVSMGVVFLPTAFLTFFVFQPYAFFDFATFSRHTLEQSQLTNDPFAFPFTLQYVGKIPYLYEIKNVTFYGLGPISALLSLSGILLLSISTVKGRRMPLRLETGILLLFFWVYFLLVGRFAVGFMRYMLPLYPLFALAAAYFLSQIWTYVIHEKKPSTVLIVFCSLFLVLSSLIWPLSFLRVYSRPNTRVQATNWMHHFIPLGSTIAIEHWDDALPLLGQEGYRMVTLTLYDEDTPEKWQTIRRQLAETDYLILASNRLYTPLMKLTDCKRLPPFRCYPETAAYYRGLFSGSLGFTLVADIVSYPTVPLLNKPLPDQHADESFTVYDHPRILIFKKDSPKSL